MNPRNELGRRVAPGIWIDRAGDTHFSIPELLKVVDLPDTPEHRALVEAMLRKRLAKEMPQAKIIFREKPE